MVSGGPGDWLVNGRALILKTRAASLCYLPWMPTWKSLTASNTPWIVQSREVIPIVAVILGAQEEAAARVILVAVSPLTVILGARVPDSIVAPVVEADVAVESKE